MLKLSHIPANMEMVDGNQSPLHNKQSMVNENTLCPLLSSMEESRQWISPSLSNPFNRFSKWRKKSENFGVMVDLAPAWQFFVSTRNFFLRNRNIFYSYTKLQFFLAILSPTWENHNISQCRKNIVDICNSAKIISEPMTITKIATISAYDN